MKLTYSKTLEEIANQGFDHTKVLGSFMRLAACCMCSPTLRPAQWHDAVTRGVPRAYRMLQVPNREDQYLEEIKQWKPKHLELFARAFAEMLTDASRHEYDDVLGTVYEEWAGHRVKQSTGEFYTPIEICYLMAKLNLRELPEDRALELSDPCCGSGNMMLGTTRVLHQELGAQSTRVRWTLQDISRTACDMAFVNCCLYGVPATIIHGDALRMQTWATYHTPWQPIAHGNLEVEESETIHEENEMTTMPSSPTIALPATRQLVRLLEQQTPLFTVETNDLDSSLGIPLVHP